MPIQPRRRAHESGPCPFPIVSIQEATKYYIPQNEEEWALAENTKKIDANDLVHELGPAGFKEWLNTSPTYVIKWDDSEIVSLGNLAKLYPKMRDPVIENLLRRSETMNIVAPPKAGKSWLGLNIAMNIIGGGNLFGRFKCERGRVLIIDNELHPETIVERGITVAPALNVPDDRAFKLIDFMSLRGKLTDLVQLGEKLQHIRRRTYNVVILDAFYKFYPKGFDENSNSEMAELYTVLDSYAEHLDSALILIHHSSKGNQSAKSVTDMGAGAGSQSRACDAHLTIREHEQPGVFVLETANRSFPPNEPFCARFKWPRWEAADNLSPEDLKGIKKKEGSYGDKKVGGKPNIPITKEQRKQEEKLKLDEFFSTVVIIPMSQGEMLSAGNGRGFYPWSRDRIRDLIEEYIKTGKLKVVAAGAGRAATTYISTSATASEFKSEIKQLTGSDEVTCEENHDGYTADFNSQENDDNPPF